MSWLAICEDVENGAILREQHLIEHLEYIETIMHKIDVAGPLSTEANDEYTSSTFIYNVETKAEAIALLHDDPYFKAGLYVSANLRRFKPVVGTWVGGKSW